MSTVTQSKLDSLLERCETLYEDLALGYVAAWKKKTGGKAIGYMPVYVPRELIYAAGVLPVGIMGGGDQIEIIKGDAYFQSYICHIPRSMVELGLSGHLDALDGMMFPAICDVIRNLSGIWKMMFPDKESIYVDFPQEFSPEIGGMFYKGELEHIKARLEALSGRNATRDRLKEAITLYNRNRELVGRLYRYRVEKPWQVSTSDVYLLLRAGNILDVAEHNQMLEDYLALVPELDRKLRDNSRIILTGSFCEQPPLGLIRSLERAGSYIVDDDFVLGSRWVEGDIPTVGDPLDNLVTAFLNHTMAGPFKYQPEDKGVQLLRSFEDNKADGVIFCAPSFCDPALLDRPMLQRFLDRHQVPYTSFKYAENTGQFQIIREQAGTFSDSIKLWGEV